VCEMRRESEGERGSLRVSERDIYYFFLIGFLFY
jgi:hypothetical protein